MAKKNSYSILLAVSLVVIVVAIILVQQPKENQVVEDEIVIDEGISETNEQNEIEEPGTEVFTEPLETEPEYIFDEEITKEKESKFKLAPELTGIVGYINTDSDISLEKHRGKVVLIDFWTYSCINCQRTLPYVTSWHSKYKDEGLVVIGVHTPEFSYEKEIEGVKAAMERHGIEYAVVQDNDKKTFRAYGNRYWPRKYLIDMDGFIRYDRIGEGGYNATETAIQALLEERKERIAAGNEESQEITPQIYFGYTLYRGNAAHLNTMEPESIFQAGAPKIVNANTAFLVGEWKYNSDHVELISDTGRIIVAYKGSTVNMIATQFDESEVLVRLDTKHLAENQKGSDIVFDEKERGVLIVDREAKYNLVDSEYGPGLLELDITGKGFRLHSFSFR